MIEYLVTYMQHRLLSFLVLAELLFLQRLYYIFLLHVVASELGNHSQIEVSYFSIKIGLIENLEWPLITEAC